MDRQRLCVPIPVTNEPITGSAKNAVTIRIGRSIAAPTLDEGEMQWKQTKHHVAKTFDEFEVVGNKTDHK